MQRVSAINDIKSNLFIYAIPFSFLAQKITSPSYDLELRFMTLTGELDLELRVKLKCLP